MGVRPAGCDSQGLCGDGIVLHLDSSDDQLYKSTRDKTTQKYKQALDQCQFPNFDMFH